MRVYPSDKLFFERISTEDPGQKLGSMFKPDPVRVHSSDEPFIELYPQGLC